MRLIVSLVAAVLPGLAAYAGFAFGHWTANPGEWEPVSRAMVAFLAVFVGPGVGLLAASFPGWDDRK